MPATATEARRTGTEIVMNAVRCDACRRVLISQTRHDFRSCPCGTFVDGGKEYLRRGVADGNTLTDLSLVFDHEAGIFMTAEDAGL